MNLIYIAAGAALLVSFFADRRKTLKALRIALKKMLSIAPAFALMLVMVSIILYLIPEDTILRYLGENNSCEGIGIAAALGSVTMMPGFVAFPLCGILAGKGVPYSVIAAFSTTLMLVGVISFPVEQKYLGTRTALLRNLVCLGAALIISIVIGLFFGDFA